MFNVEFNGGLLLSISRKTRSTNSMEKSVHQSDQSYNRWSLSSGCTNHWFVISLIDISIIFIGIIEVEYDAQRAEKEQHETKMREVQKVEELRKEKEAAGKQTKIRFNLHLISL